MKKHVVSFVLVTVIGLLVITAVCCFNSEVAFLQANWRIIVGCVSAMLAVYAFVFLLVISKSSDRTDGDLIAGAEDEDGLVFRLDTPVDELVKKDMVSFKVIHEKVKS